MITGQDSFALTVIAGQCTCPLCYSIADEILWLRLSLNELPPGELVSHRLDRAYQNGQGRKPPFQNNPYPVLRRTDLIVSRRAVWCT